MDAKGKGGQITRKKNLGTGRGLGRRSKTAGGGPDVKAKEEGRGREGTLEGKKPRGRQGPGCRTRAENRGRTDEGHGIHRHMARESRVREGPGEKVEEGKRSKRRDNRWRPAGEGKVQVDGRSAPGRVGGEKWFIQREWNDVER